MFRSKATGSVQAQDTEDDESAPLLHSPEEQEEENKPHKSFWTKKKKIAALVCCLCCLSTHLILHPLILQPFLSLSWLRGYLEDKGVGLVTDLLEKADFLDFFYFFLFFF